MKKQGFSSIELTTSLVSAAVLTMGLVSAVVVSGTALRIGPDEARDALTLGTPLAMWHEDVSDATQVTYSSDAITVSVHDRDSDSVEETVLYQIDSDQLLRSENAGPTTVIASGLGNATFSTDLENHVVGGPYYTEPGRVVLQSSRTARLGVPATSIDIALPPGVRSGELVLLSVAVDGNEQDNASVSETGWTLVEKVARSSDVSLVVWSRMIDGTEAATQTITWTASRSAVASAIRLSGVSSAPIFSSGDFNGNLNFFELLFGQTPDVPELLVPSSATVVQFVATEEGMQQYRTPGLSGYVNEYTLFSPDTSATLQAGCSLKNVHGTASSDVNNGYKFWGTGSYVMVAVVVEAGS